MFFGVFRTGRTHYIVRSANNLPNQKPSRQPAHALMSQKQIHSPRYSNNHQPQNEHLTSTTNHDPNGKQRQMDTRAQPTYVPTRHQPTQCACDQRSRWWPRLIRMPHVLRCNNRVEFISETLCEFRSEVITVRYIPAGYPWKNRSIYPFNNRMPGDRMSTGLFDTVLHARSISRSGKHSHNEYYRYSALDYAKLTECAATIG